VGVHNRPGAGGDARKYEPDPVGNGVRAVQGVWVYPPLPCWSGPATWGLYRGRGPPLPVGVPRRVDSEEPSTTSGRPLPLYPSPSVTVGGSRTAGLGRVAPVGTAASRSTRR
jgi:hypothetical protein